MSKARRYNNHRRLMCIHRLTVNVEESWLCGSDMMMKAAGLIGQHDNVEMSPSIGKRVMSFCVALLRGRARPARNN